MKQNVCTIGIDLAKKIFHLVGTDTTGKIVGATGSRALL